MSNDASRLAVEGGTPVVGTSWPKYPEFDQAVFAEIAQALRIGPMQGLSKGHPIIARLEAALADFHGVPHVLSSSSGHGALQSALIGLELTGGDEVITSPYSWGASVSCLLHNAVVPVFTDVDRDTGLMDPARLADGLTTRTRAILVPHLYGQPADMTAICAFARRHGLALIEDGSQAHGARHRGRRIGAFGDASGFSTNGVKPIATTEGGYMLAREQGVYWKACLSAQHAGRGELLGRASEPGFPDEFRPYIDTLVYTYRPSIVTALLTLERLPQLDQENEARRRNAARLRRGIAELACVSMPSYDERDECVFHMVTLNFDAARAGVGRDTFLRALVAEGVPAVGYVARGLHHSPRLSPDWSGPRVMWTETLRRAGADPTKTQLPRTDAKVAGSIEIPWNIPAFDHDLVDGIVRAFVKIEDGLDRLRALERREGGAVTTAAKRP